MRRGSAPNRPDTLARARPASSTLFPPLRNAVNASSPHPLSTTDQSPAIPNPFDPSLASLAHPFTPDSAVKPTARSVLPTYAVASIPAPFHQQQPPPVPPTPAARTDGAAEESALRSRPNRRHHSKHPHNLRIGNPASLKRIHLPDRRQTRPPRPRDHTANGRPEP